MVADGLSRGVDTIEVSTVVARQPRVVFAFLRDFTGYADYSKYLREVAIDGDGGVGTDYRLRFGWWRLTYDAFTRVTDLDEPKTLDWVVTEDIDARGRWVVEPADGDESVQFDGGEGSRVSLVVEYDPASVSSGIVDLPALVSMDWVVGVVVDLIEEEGQRVVSRVVADLEGEARDVELTVEYR